MTVRFTSRLAAAALGPCAVLAAAGPAFGHSVMKVENGTIFYTANDDVSLNKLDIEPRGGEIRFYDPGADGGINPATECDPGQVDTNGYVIEVTCPAGGITQVRADVGEAQDRINAAKMTIPVLLIGGSGADELLGGTGNDTMNADSGNDTLRGGVGNDALNGGEGDDTVTGEAGADVLQGALGADTVDGGADDDDLRVRDGVADRALCGDGNDRVQADGGDQVTACEAVDRAGGGPEQPGTQPGPGGTGTTPGGQGPGAGGAATDRTPPRLRAGGSTRQRMRSRPTSVRLVATSSEVADLTAAATLFIGGRRYVLRTARGRVSVGGGGIELRVGLDARARRAVTAALRRKRRVTVVASVVATDVAGNSSSSKLPTIRLSR